LAYGRPESPIERQSQSSAIRGADRSTCPRVSGGQKMDQGPLADRFGQLIELRLGVRCLLAPASLLPATWIAPLAGAVCLPGCTRHFPKRDSVELFRRAAIYATRCRRPSGCTLHTGASRSNRREPSPSDRVLDNQIETAFTPRFWSRAAPQLFPDWLRGTTGCALCRRAKRDRAFICAWGFDLTFGRHQRGRAFGARQHHHRATVTAWWETLTRRGLALLSGRDMARVSEQLCSCRRNVART